MTAFVAELVGTALLVTLGNGVVANVVLDKTKGNNIGFMAITIGWAMAVFIGVYASASSSGAHLNPAVTIGLAVIGKFDWALVPAYLLAQLLGAMFGALMVWVMYRAHFNATGNADAQRAAFCNTPAIRSTPQNFATEFFATMVFMLSILFLTKSSNSLGSLDALPVSLLVLAIGLSLGGPTGYAINPARDFGPRMVHALLPIHGKGGSDWAYSWIPVVAPIAGAVAAALLYSCL